MNQHTDSSTAPDDNQEVDFFARAYQSDASQNVPQSTTIPAPQVGSPALAPDTTPPTSPSSTQPPLSIPPTNATVVVSGNITEPVSPPAASLEDDD